MAAPPTRADPCAAGRPSGRGAVAGVGAQRGGVDRATLDWPLPSLLGPTTTSSPSTTVQTEPVSAVSDGTAEDGVSLSVQQAYAEPCQCAPGTYLLTARLRGEGARAWLAVDGERVGEWALGSSYREVQAVVALGGPTSTIGVASVVPGPGATSGEVLVDWLHLAGAAPQRTTAGRDILGPDRQPLVALGISKGGFEYNPFGHRATDDDASHLEEWGTSVVRLFTSQHFWSPSSCYFDPGYANRVQAEVETLNVHGIYVIVDSHYSQRGDPCAVGDNVEMADDMSLAFWRDVATRFKDNPMVGFDLYNEPHDVSWTVWRNGGDAGGYHTPGMQALYDVVRSTGATNLIYISGPEWANDLRPALTMPIDGSGIVYAAHAYCFGCRTDSSGMPLFLEAWVDPTIEEYPVALLEFGTARADLGTFNTRMIDWAKAHRVGWAAYSWTNLSNADPFGLLGRLGSYEPNLNGRPVRNALLTATG